jgi:hypothetical protein
VKHFAMLALVVVMLVTLAGVASAAKPVDGTFTIRGYTTNYTFHKLPNGLTSYHLLAKSSGSPADEAACQDLYGMRCQDTCPKLLSAACGVTGYFNGQFTYEEWGTVDYDPGTEKGSGEGKNFGALTVNASDGKVVMAELIGKTDLQSVTGKFVLQQKNGTGAQRGLKGAGDYTGSGGLVFAVTFTGKFH